MVWQDKDHVEDHGKWGWAKEWEDSFRFCGPSLDSIFEVYGGTSSQVPGRSMGKQQPLVARTCYASEPQRPSCFKTCQTLNLMVKYHGMVIRTDMGF